MNFKNNFILNQKYTILLILHHKYVRNGSPRRNTAEKNPTRNHEVAVRSLASLSGLRIWSCHELWCKSQTPLRSYVAVAVASSCSSDLTPSLGPSICHRCGPKKTKAKKNSISEMFSKTIFSTQRMLKIK